MASQFHFPKKCFVIAEVSANHGQSFQRAVKMVVEAKRAGADAIKFQTYTPDTMTLNLDNKYFRIAHSKWAGQTLYQLYQKAYTPWKWFKKLKRVADDQNIIFFSTAFDRTSVDLLEELKVPLYKVASFELVDLPLIKYIAKTKKPIILSTGMASFSEIKEAVNAFRHAGGKEITLLKCVSNYPADPRAMNLKAIPRLAKDFKVRVGLSDHTLDARVAPAAVTLGATIIEKHFILSRMLRTPDSFFSIEPQELKTLIEYIRTTEAALGNEAYGPSQEESRNKIFRRSLFSVFDIKRGDRFTEDNVRSIRPAHGLAPKYLSRVLGKCAKTNIKRGTPLHAKHIIGFKA